MLPEPARPLLGIPTTSVEWLQRVVSAGMRQLIGGVQQGK
jgi:hypothetical protein